MQKVPTHKKPHVLPPPDGRTPPSASSANTTDHLQTLSVTGNRRSSFISGNPRSSSAVFHQVKLPLHFGLRFDSLRDFICLKNEFFVASQTCKEGFVGGGSIFICSLNKDFGSRASRGMQRSFNDLGSADALMPQPSYLTNLKDVGTATFMSSDERCSWS
ncbi:hypothetical protein E5676_scaffold7319G00010 [Cucumis melo var. makuwa]|uniref:Uncharacterized protein n=2 Tax=Cucumis melo TaxID=3656 RepID=A0A5D3DSZ1_CUCMM|nr:hypothetical protein E5676_scaffold7319G00010 [Cucumis melo var. makuwa]